MRRLRSAVSWLALLGATLFASQAGAVTCTDYQTFVDSLSPSIYMRLGENSGTTAVNRPGSPDGTWETTASQGGTSLITGNSDTTYSSDALLRSVTYPDDTRNRAAAGMTWNLWMKYAHSPASIATEVVWNTFTASPTGDIWAIAFINGTSDKVRCQIKDVSAATVFFVDSAGSTSFNGSTHMVTCRWSAATGICVTVDNGTTTCATANFTVDTSTVNGVAQLNCFAGTDVSCSTGTGQFDEVTYFKTRLTDQNVSDMYDAGASGCTPATATPTPTPTPTNTATPTPTPTLTPTPTPTPTASPSPTNGLGGPFYRNYMKDK